MMTKLKDFLHRRPSAWYMLYLPVYLLLFFAVEKLVPSTCDYWVSYLPLDACIPFCEYFVVFYCMWYPLLIATAIYLFVNDDHSFRLYGWFIIIGFTGTLLFVSHDRYFVSRFANRIIVLMDGEMIDFTGNYEQYLAFRERKAAEKAAAVTPKPKKEKPKPKGGTKQLEKKIAKLEREISQCEEQSAALDEQMAAAASDPGKLMELSNQKDEVETQLMELMEQWEQLSAQLEEMQDA